MSHELHSFVATENTHKVLNCLRNDDEITMMIRKQNNENKEIRDQTQRMRKKNNNRRQSLLCGVRPEREE